MRHTVKLLLWKHQPNKAGHCPIYLKVTINRKTSYSSTGYFIDERHWDAIAEQVKPSQANANLINADILDRKTEALKKIVHARIDRKSITSSQAQVKGSATNYFNFVDQIIGEGKKSAGTLENYRKHTERLALYHGSRELGFEDITPDYLSAFEQDLRKTVEVNYTHQLLKTIRSMFNVARKRKLITEYPFATYEMPRYDGPQKEYLTIDEIKKFEQFADRTKDPVKREAAIYLILGCATGLRISDWKKFSDKSIKDGMVKLRATKNGEWVVMPVNKILQRNLVRMKKYPLTIQEPTINEKIKLIAKELGIDKHLTTHSGRHTYAIALCAERGISAETCAELMGITVQTCVENYYRVTNKKIRDEASKAWKGL